MGDRQRLHFKLAALELVCEPQQRWVRLRCQRTAVAPILRLTKCEMILLRPPPQQPGDMIFVPEGWWHATLNLGEVLAVAVLEFVAAD